jgi:hypothetical protein
MVLEDHTIPGSSGVSFRGSVKVELDEILWGTDPKRRSA